MSEETIDLTKMRLGSRFNGRKIQKCPKCGRKGFVSRYKNGSGAGFHSGFVQMGCFTMTDPCYWKPADLSAIKS